MQDELVVSHQALSLATQDVSANNLVKRLSSLLLILTH